MKKRKKWKALLIAAILGGIVGFICWAFLALMGAGLYLFWEFIPAKIYSPYYPIVICMIGGFIIGALHKKYGDYPEKTETILKQIKEKDKPNYDNLPQVTIMSLLPLIFGGSLGPEAALTGMIAKLCTWVSDKFKFLGKEVKEVSQLGFAATMGIIFRSPLYAFVNDVEGQEEMTIPKNSKVIIYFVTILSGFGIFLLLQNIYSGLDGLAHFTELTITNTERLWFLPLVLVGTLAGLCSYLFEKIARKVVHPVRKYPIIKAIMGGFVLGLIGMFLPYTMFSGEAEMGKMMLVWDTMTFGILLVLSLAKLFVTNLCIQTGWKGGNIFPVIFAGVTLGYAFATILPIDPVYSVMVVTTALVSAVMRKPIAVVMLLMLCFPTEGMITMVVAAIIASAIPLPKGLAK